jgi:phosphatidylglycerophosphate synthase
MENSTSETKQSQIFNNFKNKVPKRKNLFEAFYNFLASLVTPLFLNTSWTPNQLTIISGVFGIAGAALLIFQGHFFLITAGICIQIFTILDLVDGNIARAKKMQSNFGAWLDAFFDKLNDFLIITGLTIGAYRSVDSIHVLILGMCLMGFVFYIQYIMKWSKLQIICAEIAEKSNPGSAQQHRKMNNSAAIVSTLKFIFQNVKLGHCAFLFLVSFFAFCNSLYFGLCFLVIHAFITLAALVALNFLRLREQ